MKTLLFALAVVGALGGPVLAADADDVLATVQKFVDGFNKGDTAMVAATHAVQISIVDEFPPYAWQGERAWLTWMNDYGSNAKKDSITDGVVKLDKPNHVDVAGDFAYVVAPANYSYNQRGKPVKETGSMFTLALHRGKGGWRITGWSWAKN